MSEGRGWWPVTCPFTRPSLHPRPGHFTPLVGRSSLHSSLPLVSLVTEGSGVRGTRGTPPRERGKGAGKGRVNRHERGMMRLLGGSLVSLLMSVPVVSRSPTTHALRLSFVRRRRVVSEVSGTRRRPSADEGDGNRVNERH